MARIDKAGGQVEPLRLAALQGFARRKLRKADGSSLSARAATHSHDLGREGRCWLRVACGHVVLSGWAVTDCERGVRATVNARNPRCCRARECRAGATQSARRHTTQSQQAWSRGTIASRTCARSFSASNAATAGLCSPAPLPPSRGLGTHSTADAPPDLQAATNPFAIEMATSTCCCSI